MTGILSTKSSFVFDAPVRIVLQARSSSIRLPRKVLLNVGGLPLAALCALRLSNTGLPVTVATSIESSDDELVAAIPDGIAVCRGSLDDVLARFLLATSDLGPDAIVVRATADNPLPDGHFVFEVVRQLVRRQSDFVGIDFSNSGAPYGLSCEAFRISSLRKRATDGYSRFEAEHVTPHLRESSSAVFLGSTDLGIKHSGELRCTIDTHSDFLRLGRIFEGISDPTRVGYQELLALLSQQHGCV